MFHVLNLISSLSGGRHGSDSAVGSSATLSGDQAPSSPPSWASSPPASPDSAVTAVSYIPDQQAVLQRVSFTTSSEVRQVGRTTGQQETSRSTAAPYTPSITSIGGAVLRRVYSVAVIPFLSLPLLTPPVSKL